MTRIITHGGRAHCDEVLAISIIIAFNKLRIDEVEILRRDPTPIELDYEDIFVVDVGGKLDERKNCFDHHQYQGGKCAFRLVADAYGLDKIASEVFPWWEFKSDMDTMGPIETSKKYGIADSKVSMSPVDHLLIASFEENPNDMFVKEFIRRLGDSIIAGILKHKRLMAKYDESVQIVDVDDLKVAYFLDTEVQCLNAWLNKNAPEVSVTVTKDARSEGLSMYRVGDTTKVDFKWIGHYPEVGFVHKAGFLATTKNVDADWKKLIRAAMKVS